MLAATSGRSFEADNCSTSREFQQGRNFNLSSRLRKNVNKQTPKTLFNDKVLDQIKPETYHSRVFGFD